MKNIKAVWWLMKFQLIFQFVVLFFSCGEKKNQTYRQLLTSERIEQNEEFLDPKRSPVNLSEFPDFKGLSYFPIDETYRVNARVECITGKGVFDLPHSHNRSKPYTLFGFVHFELKGNPYTLQILEPVLKKKGYEDYLLLPFSDETNGTETYGGGRYIDFSKKDTGTTVIDFNKAYNPYCAYSSAYTCPIPPKENYLPLRVEAGVKYDH